MKTFRLSTVVVAIAFAFRLLGQANGNLQIHYIDVGQADAALLISPLGKTVMFDSGGQGMGDKVIAYLQQLGITKIDYLITSHYHADHCGCVAQVFKEISLTTAAYDRGEPAVASPTFKAYDAALHALRKTVVPGTTLKLDDDSANPVTIKFVAANGDGVSSKDENDLSVAAVINFGKFDAESSGDLSGFTFRDYHDIETSVAPMVGQIEVYKAHHHGSEHSTNPTWLAVTQPKVAIISCGDGNQYGHPTQSTLDALHEANVITYWTETGHGAEPVAGKDYVGGNIVVQVPPPGESFTVNFADNQVHTYTCWGVQPAPAPASPTPSTITYTWSKNAHVYHYSDCSYVKSISPQNLRTGTTPPAGMALHEGCPR